MTPKISLFTECMFGLTLMEAIAASAETGVKAIELACRPPHLDLNTATARSDLVMDQLRRHKLKVSALSLYTSFTDSSTWKDQVAAAESYIRLAPRYETDVVKVTPGRPGSAEASPDHWKLFGEAVRVLVSAAEETGIRLAFETHMRQLTDSLAGSLRVLDMSDSPALGFTVDFSNLSFAGEKMSEVFAGLRRRMYNTHIKNGLVDARGDWWFLPLDTGWTDYVEVCRLLREHAYDGYLTVECLGKDAMTHPVVTAKRDIAMLQQYLER